MDLGDKFDNYQTEVDAEAWKHFRLLRDNQRPKRRFFWWFFFGGMLLLGGITFWTFNQDRFGTSRSISDNSTNNKTIIIEKEKQQTAIIEENKINLSKQKEITTSINENGVNLSAQKEITSHINKLAENINMTSSSNNKAVNKIATSVESVSLQKASPIQSTIENIGYSNTKTTKQKNVQSETLEQNNLPFGISNKEDLAAKNTTDNYSPKTSTYNNAAINRELDFVAKIRLLNNELQINTDSLNKLDIPLVPTLGWSNKQNKNTIKFGANFADGFINGFAIENPVNKQGLAFQIEYYHEWNKIIATGISAGYVKGVDRNNPTFVIKDRETIKFLHANIYLFLLNENKHRLYAKVGSGLTNTDRVLGFPFVDINGEVERDFQINNLTNIGLLVEGAYEYKLRNSFIIGVNFSIISHNDGGWFTGLSIGHQF